MPQMSPMSWTLILLMSMMINIQLSTNLYFSTKNKLNKKTLSKKMKTHWKW